MRVTHGWYEKDKDAEVFSRLSSVTIELDQSERWELTMILGAFISDSEKKRHMAGLKLAKNLRRQVAEDPNPNVPFYKKENAELKEEIKRLKNG